MSDNLKRINPKDVPELFKKNKFSPIRENFYTEIDGDPCGCINTILAVESAGKDLAINIAGSSSIGGTEDSPKLAALSGLDSNYSIGLARGWDDNRTHSKDQSPEEQAGFEDGVAAWNACVSSMTVFSGGGYIYVDDEEDTTNA